MQVVAFGQEDRLAVVAAVHQVDRRIRHEGAPEPQRGSSSLSQIAFV
jgi:hypothetical protein